MLDHDRNELKTLTSTVFDFLPVVLENLFFGLKMFHCSKKNHKTCSSGFVIRQIILRYHLHCCFKIWEVPTPVNSVGTKADQCLLLS